MPKDYGTFTTAPPDLSAYSSSFPAEPIRRTIKGKYSAIKAGLRQALDDAMLHAGLRQKKLLVLLGEHHGDRLALWAQMLALDALRSLDDGDEFEVLGLELSAQGLRNWLPGKQKILQFAQKPDQFLQQNDLNVRALMAFAILSNWALAGCEPNQEANLYGQIDFFSSTPQRHQAFAMRNVVTIRRLQAFKKHLVFACGLGHLSDIANSPFLKRQFHVVTVCHFDSDDTAYYPTSGNLILVQPTTTISAEELVVGYLQREHKDFVKTALKGVTIYLDDPK